MKSLRALIRNVIVALLLIVVVFGAYFFVYIRSRESQIATHQLRLLASTGNYASDALEGLLTNVRNAVALSRKEIHSLIPDDSTGMKVIETKRHLIPGLEAYSGVSDRKALDSLLDDPNAAYTLTPSGDPTTVRLAVELKHPASDPQLDFAFSRSDFDSLVVWQMNLPELLAPTMPEGFFDGVLVVRSSGEVLFGAGTSHLQITHFHVPAPRETKDDKSTALPESTASQVYDLTVAGESYKFFVQPMRVPILINSRDENGRWRPENQWLVVGFVPVARFRALTMAIPPAHVLTAIGLIVIGLLSMPILRVRFMGGREELRYADIGVLALAIVLTASFTTFGSLFYLMNQHDAISAEDRLDHLSKSIRGQFDREVKALDRTLVEVTDRRIVRDATPEVIMAFVWRSIIFDAKTTLRANLLTNDAPRPDGARHTLRSEPFLDMVIWVNSLGMQTAKWGIRQTPTPIISVKKRKYFSEPIKGVLWSAPSPDPRFRDGLFIESIRSITTGREAAVLSRAYATDFSDPGNAIAAVESRLRSVIEPVLPEGDGFAVVDERGTVQFHSERVRNIRENLFSELGNDRAVRRAVESRQRAVVRTTYRTVPSVIQVSPIDSTPWSLVVFEDGRVSQRWQVETVALSLAVFMAHIVLLTLGALVVLWLWPAPRRPGEPRRLWYWPQRKQRARYENLLLCFGALILLWTVVIATGLSWLILPAVALLPIGSLVLFRVGLRKGLGNPWWPGWTRGLGTRSVYGLLITAVVFMTGVLPTIGIFRLTHYEVQSRDLQTRQLAFANAIRNRQRDQLRWYDDVLLAEPYLTTIADNVYGLSSAKDQIGYDTPMGWEWEFGAPKSGRLRPPSLPVSAALRGIMGRFGVPVMAADLLVTPMKESYEWGQEPKGGGRLEFRSRDLIYPGQLGSRGNRRDSLEPRELTIAAIPGRLNFGTDPSFWVLGLFGTAVMFWVVRFSVRHAFLGGVSKPRWVTLGELKLADVFSLGEKDRLVRAIVLRRLLNDEDRSRLHIIGIHEVRTAKETSELLRAIDEKKDGVLLTQFDYGLKEREIVRKKLDLLEALNAFGPTLKLVCIESSIEPLHFLTARYQENYQRRDDLGIAIDRWSSALQPYVLLRKGPRRERVEVLEKVAKNDADTKDTLRVEGAPTPVLKLIAERIGAQSNAAELKRDDVVEAVLEMAQPHYRRLWTSCSSEEKLLLYWIAKEGLVNLRAKDILRPLLWRGLVLLRPNCCLMNESFRSFVLAAERPEVFAKWQQRGELSVWARMKVPAMLSLGVLAVFFFATQRGALNQSLGLLAAVAAIAPGILGALSGLSHARPQKN